MHFRALKSPLEDASTGTHTLCLYASEKIPKLEDVLAARTLETMVFLSDLYLSRWSDDFER